MRNLTQRPILIENHYTLVEGFMGFRVTQAVWMTSFARIAHRVQETKKAPSALTPGANRLVSTFLLLRAAHLLQIGFRQIRCVPRRGWQSQALGNQPDFHPAVLGFVRIHFVTLAFLGRLG